jgi:hypothetical protein
MTSLKHGLIKLKKKWLHNAIYLLLAHKASPNLPTPSTILCTSTVAKLNWSIPKNQLFGKTEQLIFKQPSILYEIELFGNTEQLRQRRDLSSSL